MQKQNIPFRSPFQKGHGSRPGEGTPTQTVAELQKKLDGMCKEIEELKGQGYKESELKTHIDKLHEYNEVKDIAQSVLGQLATLKGVRTRDLYEQYGLNLDD